MAIQLLTWYVPVHFRSFWLLYMMLIERILPFRVTYIEKRQWCDHTYWSVSELIKI